MYSTDAGGALRRVERAFVRWGPACHKPTQQPSFGRSAAQALIGIGRRGGERNTRGTGVCAGALGVVAHVSRLKSPRRDPAQWYPAELLSVAVMLSS